MKIPILTYTKARIVSIDANFVSDSYALHFATGGTTSMHHPAPKTSTSIKNEPEPRPECDLRPNSTQRPEMFLPPSKVDSVTPTPAQRSGTLGSNVTGAPQRSFILGLSSKSLLNLNTLPTKPSSDEMVKATAVAAGARIVTPSDAVSLLKTSGNSLPSNVHYIRTGLATTLSSYSSAPPNDSRLKPTGAAFHGNHPRQTGPKLNVASQPTKVATSGLVIEVETKFLEGMIPNSADALRYDNCGDEHVDMDICKENSANKKTNEQVLMDADENLGVKQEVSWR